MESKKEAKKKTCVRNMLRVLGFRVFGVLSHTFLNEQTEEEETTYYFPQKKKKKKKKKKKDEEEEEEA